MMSSAEQGQAVGRAPRRERRAGGARGCSWRTMPAATSRRTTAGIPLWLLAVYAVLFVWAMYYLYVYWGGLGPGLAY